MAAIPRPPLENVVMAAVACVMSSILACNARPVPDPDPIPVEVRAFASARCQTLEICGCASDNYRDRTECEDEIITLYLEHLDGDETLDLACFESAARSWRKDLCDDPAFDPPCDVVEPTRQLGEWCSGVDLFRDPFARAPFCAEGLGCLNKTCVELVPERQEGEPCSPDGLCGTSELSCFAGQCETPRPEGGDCETIANCERGLDVALYCEDGTCVARKDEGEPCVEETECSSLRCVGGQCIPASAIVCFSAELLE